MSIFELLNDSLALNASDLHLSSGLVPMVRVDGEMQRLDYPALTLDILSDLLESFMTDQQSADFAEHLETDFSYAYEDIARFRVNVFQQNRGPCAVLRTIPATVLSMDQLAMGQIFRDIASLPRGLVLVTGPTGSRKSTTLAALINFINQSRRQHILTIEDPIEFIHQSQQSLVNQREVHRHTLRFNQALRSALREDPDIILVGELRDLETIRLALTAAETGRLVFATLHTSSAAKTIDRIVDVFPANEKTMVRSMLSESLQAVISQTLIKRVNGGRIAAHEIMLATRAIRNLIREDKVAQMYSAIQTGGKQGMQTMDQCLKALVIDHLISVDHARARARQADDFN